MTRASVTALVPLAAKILSVQLEMEQLTAMLHDAWMRGDMVKQAMCDGRTRGPQRDVYFFLLWELSFEEWQPVKMLQLIHGIGSRAQKGAVSAQTIRNGLKWLVRAGYLEKRSPGPNLPNEYRLVWRSPVAQEMAS